MALTTQTISTRGGDATLTIDTVASGTIFINTDSKVEIIYDYDIDRGDAVIDTLQFTHGALELTLWDLTDEGESLISLIQAEADDRYNATLNFNGDNFRYVLKRELVQFDQRRRTCKLLLSSKPLTTDSFDTIFDAAPDKRPIQPSGRFVGNEVITANNFIGQVLRSFDTTATNIIHQATVARTYTHGGNSYVLDTIYDSVVADERIHFVVGKRTGLTYPAAALFNRLAAARGFIYGNGFGTNFFILRLPSAPDAATVELTADDIDDIEVIRGSSNVGQFSVRLVNTGDSNLLTDTVGVINTGDQRTLEYGYNFGNGVSLAVYDGSNTRFESGAGTINTIRNAGGAQPENHVVGGEGATAGVDAYRLPYGGFFSGTPALRRVSRIKLTVNDVSKVKPWNTVKIIDGSGGVPNTTLFRGATMRYDLIASVAKLDMYRITG